MSVITHHLLTINKYIAKHNKYIVKYNNCAVKYDKYIVKCKKRIGINSAFPASVFPFWVKDKASTMPTGQLKYMCAPNFKLWLILYLQTF